MIEDLKNFRVNWTDGMKISKNHFNEIQNYIQELGRDITSFYLNENNYGLLPSRLSKASINVTLNAHNSISVSIQRLSAITPNGSRIEINDLTLHVEQSFSIEEIINKRMTEAYIVLSINPNKNNAFGEQNKEEVPPRLPFINNSFLFKIVDKTEIESAGVSAFQLPIAKIKNVNGNLEINDKYIPPCVNVGANDNLIDFYNYAESFLNQLEINSIRIVKKIRMESNKNPIADVIYDFCNQLLTFLGREITTIESEGLSNTPMDIMNTVKSMARVIKNRIDTYHPKQKESLFIYFGEWVDLKAGDFEKLFINTINLDYSHYDLFLPIVKVNEFITTINKLFDILTELDYIGKKKDTGLFVNERQISQGNSSNTPSFFAD